MAVDPLKLDWNSEPKNGQNEFISSKSYVEYSASYKILMDDTYRYYTNIFNEEGCLNERTPNQDLSNEKEEIYRKTVKGVKKGNKKIERKFFSTLSAEQQTQYLQLFQKYSNQQVNVSSEKERMDVKLLAELHSKVVAEQKRFMEYQKSLSISSKDYFFIHPEIQRYVKDLIKEKLQSCLLYPRHYKLLKKIIVSENIFEDKCVIPHLIHKLLKLGRVPRLVTPSLDKNYIIENNYLKLCRRFPVSLNLKQSSQQLSFKKPVSQDSIAKTLADKYSADIITTLSGLKLLLDTQKSNTDTSWELPIVVITSTSESSSSCGQKTNSKHIYIDKTIPTGIWSPMRKNKLYYKYAVKLHFTHFNPSKKERNKKINIQNNNQEREISVLQDELFESDFLKHETFGQNCSNDYQKSFSAYEEGIGNKNNKLKETVHKFENEKLSESENKLKRHHENEINNENIKNLKSSICENTNNDTISCDLKIHEYDNSYQYKNDNEKEEPDNKKKKLEESVPFLHQLTSHQSIEEIKNLKSTETEEVTEVLQSLDLEKKNYETNSLSEDSDDGLIIDESQISEINVVDNVTDNLTDMPLSSCNNDVSNEESKKLCLQNSNKIQNDDNSNNETKQIKDIECSSTTDGTIQEEKKTESTLDQILCLQEEMLSAKLKISPSKSYEKCDQNSESDVYIEDASKFMSEDDFQNKNAAYSLWQMGELKILLRRKLDCKDVINHIPRFLFSKLEYQAQFGCEIVTESDLLKEWITLFTHPNSTGLRVRTDVMTSKVLLTEELTLNKLQKLIDKLYPEKLFCWVKNLFINLKELDEGHYLLVHQENEDALMLYCVNDCNKRDDFDLHTAITQRLVALDDGWKASKTTKIPWLPINTDIILPSFLQNGRIPATFPPKPKK